jgi:hypothetical protein
MSLYELDHIKKAIRTKADGLNISYLIPLLK